MKYQLHDIDLDLWAWVKAQATRRQTTINNFIEVVLADRRNRQKGTDERRIIDGHYKALAQHRSDPDN